MLSSAFLEGRVRSSFQLNITPSSFELIDMWLMYSPADRASIRIGQFKVPYTRYRA